MEDECKETFHNFETTFSSELLSLPSGHKLDNISSVNEISDSELDGKKMFSDDDNPLEKIAVQDPQEMSEPKESYQYELPLQVRNTLQANSNLLCDKNILNDLLDPKKSTSSNSPVNLQLKFGPFRSQMSTGVQGANSELEKSLLSDVPESSIFAFNRPVSKPKSSSPSRGVSNAPYLSVSSTPKKIPPNSTSRINPPVTSEEIRYPKNKHVNFMPESGNDNLYKEASDSYSIMQNHPKRLPSFISYGPEKMLDKLGEIRNNLEIKFQEEGEDVNSSDLPLSRLLVAKLNSQKQRTKDLEEELTLNEASLAKITCELEIVQKRLFRREEQLKEAGDQIGRLQTEWQGVQRKLLSSREKFQLENEQMKKIMECMKIEKGDLEKELRNLREETKELTCFKANAEGMKSLMEVSCKRSEEIKEENVRLSKSLTHFEQRSSHLEKEKESLEQKVECLHNKLDSLTLIKNSLEEEMRSLKERHSVLLQKAVDETELKEKATSEKIKMEEMVQASKLQQQNLISDINRHYQSQLETILAAKVKNLTEDFETRLKRMEKEFQDQTNSLKETNEKREKELTYRHKEEMESLKIRYEHELEKRSKELTHVKKENDLLRVQREAIVNALSGGVPLSTDQTKTDLGKFCHNGKTQVSQEPNKHYEPIEKLKPYSFEQKEPSREPAISHKLSKEHRPQRWKGVSVRPFTTSTSLSSLSPEVDSSSSEGRVTVRERKPTPREKRKANNRQKTPARGFHLHRDTSAAHTSGMTDSYLSSNRGANSGILKEVDKEMAEIVQEINSLSGFMVVNSTQETPHHDTSIEQDSAQSALRRIDMMSNMLANTWSGRDE